MSKSFRNREREKLNLSDAEKSFISVDELKEALINISKTLTGLIPENNEKLSLEIKEQTDILNDIVEKEILIANLEENNEFSDSDDNFFSSSSCVIDFDDKNIKIDNSKASEEYQKNEPEKEIKKKTNKKEKTDFVPKIDESKGIDYPKPLFHPRPLSSVSQIDQKGRKRQRSNSPPPVFNKRIKAASKRNPEHFSDALSANKGKKASNKYDYLVSSYAQRRKTTPK